MKKKLKSGLILFLNSWRSARLTAVRGINNAQNTYAKATRQSKRMGRLLLDNAESYVVPAEGVIMMDEKSLEALKRHEGFRAKPYRCTAGKLTIGFGTNLDAGITEQEASMLLAWRVATIERRLQKEFPWWSNLTSSRQGALIDMAYNLGVAGLLGFVTTLNRLSVKDYDGAASAMLASHWAAQVGSRAVELAQIIKGN